jgi:hypothetical protein
MPDPLRSLSELIRTLMRPRTERRGAATRTESSKSAREEGAAYQAPAVAGGDALREKLRERLKLVQVSDQARAREVFVETVLASELGDRVTLDPAMGEIVSRVARQLGEDASTAQDLQALIEDLARQETSG